MDKKHPTLKTAAEEGTRAAFERLWEYWRGIGEDLTELLTKEVELDDLKKLLELLRSMYVNDQYFRTLSQVLVDVAQTERTLSLLMQAGMMDVLSSVFVLVQNEREKNLKTTTLIDCICTIQNLSDHFTKLPQQEVASRFLNELGRVAISHADWKPESRAAMVTANLIASTKAGRDIIQQKPIDLERIVNLMKECGDGQFQRAAAEFLYRCRSQWNKTGEILDKLLGSVELADQFRCMSKDCFAKDMQSFIEKFNASLPEKSRVYTITVESVTIGSLTQQKLAMDFGPTSCTILFPINGENIDYDLEYAHIKRLTRESTKKTNTQYTFTMLEVPPEFVVLKAEHIAMEIGKEHGTLFRNLILPTMQLEQRKGKAGRDQKEKELREEARAKTQEKMAEEKPDSKRPRPPASQTSPPPKKRKPSPFPEDIPKPRPMVLDKPFPNIELPSFTPGGEDDDEIFKAMKQFGEAIQKKQQEKQRKGSELLQSGMDHIQGEFDKVKHESQGAREEFLKQMKVQLGNVHEDIVQNQDSLRNLVQRFQKQIQDANDTLGQLSMQVKELQQLYSEHKIQKMKQNEDEMLKGLKESVEAEFEKFEKEIQQMDNNKNALRMLKELIQKFDD